MPLVGLPEVLPSAIRDPRLSLEPQEFLSCLPIAVNPAVDGPLAHSTRVRIYGPAHPTNDLLRREALFTKVLDIVLHAKVVLNDE